jgi:hypothetical protein
MSATMPECTASRLRWFARSFRSNPGGNRELCHRRGPWASCKLMRPPRSTLASPNHLSISTKISAAALPTWWKRVNRFHGDLRFVMAAYAAGERPISARGLNYLSSEVYAYVRRIAQQYRAELGGEGGK